MSSEVVQHLLVGLDLLGDAFEQDLLSGSDGRQRDLRGAGSRPGCTGDGVPVRAGQRMPEHLVELRGNLVGDHVLPPARLDVGFVPVEADQIGEEPFRQAMLAHNRLCPLPSGLSEHERAPGGFDVSLFAQAPHDL